jgi:hypothetical protein
MSHVRGIALPEIGIYDEGLEQNEAGVEDV